MKRYVRASEETVYNMTVQELISFLDDIKYDLIPDNDYTLVTSDELIVDIFWGGNFTNVGYYPIVQIDYQDKIIFKQEGTEEPGNWYKVIDQAINKISAEFVLSINNIPEYSNDIKNLAKLEYESPDIVIGRYFSDDNKVYVYHYCDYSTPLRSRQTSGWLNAGVWKLYPDGLWYEYNTVSGGKNSEGASTFEEIADIVRKI